MIYVGPVVDYAMLAFKGPYSATLTATDPGGQSLTFYFHLTVTDGNGPPEITNLPNSVSIQEDQTISENIFTTAASDPDGDSFIFSLATTIPSGGPFTITSDGIVKVNANPNLNYESVKQYELEITATDIKNAFTKKTLFVNISDINEIPVLTNLPNTFSIYENYSSNSIFNVTAIDDDGDVLNFSMEDQSVNGFFLIDSLTGSIKLSPDSIIDFETTEEYFLNVSVDDTNLKNTAQLTIKILNINEKPIYTGTTKECSIKENSVGFLMKLNATDPENSGILYEIEKIYPNSNSFSIHSSSG